MVHPIITVHQLWGICVNQIFSCHHVEILPWDRWMHINLFAPIHSTLIYYILYMQDPSSSRDACFKIPT